MVRTMKTKRTVVRPIESTVGKSRRKLVLDSIELADLGCHAFKDSPIPKGRCVMRHALSHRVNVNH